MMVTRYARPQGQRHLLRSRPALASWDKAGTASRQASLAFVDDVSSIVGADLASAPGEVGLLLEIALPQPTPLFALNDLDNYLFPLVPHLSRLSGRAFATVWATKYHGTDSYVTVAAPQPDAAAGEPSYQVETTASASTTAYKVQIRDQLLDADVVAGEGVLLDLAFTTGPTRAWPNLWKATIDALGAILGRDEGAREWNSRDGRITDLRLHNTVDASLGNRVQISIRASQAR